MNYLYSCRIPLFISFVVLFHSIASSKETEFEQAVHKLNDEWELQNYSKTPSEEKLESLLDQAKKLKETYPNRAELLTLEGLILLSLAELESGLSSPNKISHAMDDLEQSIALVP